MARDSQYLVGLKVGFCALRAPAVLSCGCNEVYLPQMCDYIHFFSGASSGAFWCNGGISCIKNKILRSDFGGYTAHHPTTSKHFRRRPTPPRNPLEIL